MIDIKKCWAALHSYTNCSGRTCEECKRKYLIGDVEGLIDDVEGMGCPIDIYKDEVISLTKVLESIIDTKDQITSEEFANYYLKEK